MTPLPEIAGLKIGSRPASRTKSDRIEDLRAIPWVFSWAQARVMLPGWYGVGQALKGFGDMALLREMLEAWPFLQATLANLEMVLAKSDMGIARHYAGLVEDQDMANDMFGRIRDGWHMAHDCLLSVTRQTRLLEKNPMLDDLDPAAPALYRAAQPPSDRAAAPPPRRRGRSAHPRGHRAFDQRDRDGAAQQRLRISAASSHSWRPRRRSRSASAGRAWAAARRGSARHPPAPAAGSGARRRCAIRRARRRG